MTEIIEDLLNKPDYLFFNYLENTKEYEKYYKPPYLLKIKLSNYDDNCFITLETDKVLAINELPQNIMELVNKYDLISHYITSYPDNFYLHFDIKFISNFDCLHHFFSICVDKLKKMIKK